jgi:hypothetical protein
MPAEQLTPKVLMRAIKHGCQSSALNNGKLCSLIVRAIMAVQNIQMRALIKSSYRAHDHVVESNRRRRQLLIYRDPK